MDSKRLALAAVVVLVLVAGYYYYKKNINPFGGKSLSLSESTAYYISNGCQDNASTSLFPASANNPSSSGGVYTLATGTSLVLQPTLTGANKFYLNVFNPILAAGNAASGYSGEAFLARVYTTDPATGATIYLTWTSAGTLVGAPAASSASDPSQQILVMKFGGWVFAQPSAAVATVGTTAPLVNALSPTVAGLGSPSLNGCVGWRFIPA